MARHSLRIVLSRSAGSAGKPSSKKRFGTLRAFPNFSQNGNNCIGPISHLLVLYTHSIKYVYDISQVIILSSNFISYIRTKGSHKDPSKPVQWFLIL